MPYAISNVCTLYLHPAWHFTIISLLCNGRSARMETQRLNTTIVSIHCNFLGHNVWCAFHCIVELSTDCELMRQTRQHSTFNLGEDCSSSTITDRLLCCNWWSSNRCGFGSSKRVEITDFSQFVGWQCWVCSSHLYCFGILQQFSVEHFLATVESEIGYKSVSSTASMIIYVVN